MAPSVKQWRVGYGRAHTVQDSEINSSADQDEIAFAREALRFVTALSTEASKRHLEAQTVEIATALTGEADATTIAGVYAGVHDGSTRPWALELATEPLDLDLDRRIWVDYPVAGLAGGKTAQIFGEQVESGGPGQGGSYTLLVVA